MAITLDQLLDDVTILKAMIVAQSAETARLEASVKAYGAMIEALKLRIARLRRQKFGRSSEKIEREIEQLELALEALEVKQAADDTSARNEDDPTSDTDPAERKTPRRRGKPG